MATPKPSVAAALLACLAAPVRADGGGWVRYPGRVCQGGRGGVQIGSVGPDSSSFYDSMTRETCQARCNSNDDCQGIMFMGGSDGGGTVHGPCWMLRALDVRDCIEDASRDLFVLDSRSSRDLFEPADSPTVHKSWMPVPTSPVNRTLLAVLGVLGCAIIIAAGVLQVTRIRKQRLEAQERLRLARMASESKDHRYCCMTPGY